MTKLSVSILYAVLLSAPMAMAQGDLAAKVVPQVMGKNPEESRPWRAPVFSDQDASLGYHGEAFSVPKGMEKQVQFWIDIYTKYSTTQGVIHDAENVETVYEVVDLTGLVGERAQQKKIDEVKKAIGLKLSKDEKDRLRFQLGQKDRMQDAIFYSGRYIEDMEKIFRDAKVPVELTRLAFVESSFNIMARSKVGASGIWQIMPYTAKPYKMISATVDKRNHPMEATKLAAKLLRQNYSMLQSWPLAVTGYNHGPTGVRKMTENYKTRELGELVANVRSRKSFGFASRNFYASFLAALEVEKHANKYFGSVVWSKPLDAQDLKLPVAVKYKEIVSWFDGDDRKAQIFNPHLTFKARKGHPIPAKTVIAVPKDKYNVALISLARRDRMVAMERK
ncbi:lytic transglycosylase domain-containing protein [Bdellovibrio bacteriovorus]|uniref:lytic transglycosylase domain-containing protein n=1 Tax=Bdellovibrio bacteriovorus TaxID=959 RepID=UPI0021D256F3|nr:lytic transglycosylase domain-containing protein [Bdellovibrio bacteriovorus]UXR64395.1 lytic transglycosylase domain-containing protein [Bdellovibrio bacteriovorus]